MRDYADIAKPLTKLLSGEDGRISEKMWDKKPVLLDEEALEAFEKVKRALISHDIILHYSDFGKEFHLITDASNYALGAVLQQDSRPISFISRTLSKTEENYTVK